MIDDLKQQIEQRYDIQLTSDWQPIINGDECRIWRVDTPQQPVIVRVSPAWRTVAELQWVHHLTQHCAATIAEVVAPITARNGTTLFIHEEHPVCLFPFVEGEDLDTNDSDLCVSAARLLARIHQTSATWNSTPRPASKATAPQPLPPERYPNVFVDAELDRWHESLDGLIIGAIHGDYYCRNILCDAGRIQGVIDWDETQIAPLMAEVGWSAWEFSQVDSEDDLDDDKARAFLAAYFEANPPCAPSEKAHAIAFMRWRLRDEAVRALAAAERGEDWDKEYTEQEMRAFQNLRGRIL